MVAISSLKKNLTFWIAFSVSFTIHAVLAYMIYKAQPKEEEFLDLSTVVMEAVNKTKEIVAVTKPPELESVVSKKTVTNEIIKTNEPIPIQNSQTGDDDDDFSKYIPSYQVATLPVFGYKVDPEIPPIDFQNNILQGEVLIEVWLDRKGDLRRTRVIKSSSKNFEEEVLKAVWKSRFKPAISKSGNPVAVRMRIPYRYAVELR